MDYKNGKIYTLRSHQTDNIYIGSTASLLPKRLYQHKRSYKCYLNGKSHYVTSFEILKFDDCYIELLEDYPCQNYNQLFKREGELIRAHDCVNKCVPSGLQKTERNKQYRDEHKEEIKEKLKEYYQDNKDKLIEQQKQYYQNNKEKLIKKINCECGGKYTYQHKSLHIKSQKHHKYLQNSN